MPPSLKEYREQERSQAKASNGKSPHEKGSPHGGEPFSPLRGANHHSKQKTFLYPARGAYFHKLLYLAAMPSVRSTSLSTSPSTSS